jgi:hypothetical protein
MKTTIETYTKEREIYHRVQVYAGTSLLLARKLEQQVRNNGYPESFVIAR